MIRPMRPDRLWGRAAHAQKWGRTPAAGRRAVGALPRGDDDRRRARHAHLHRGRHAHERAGARAVGRRARRGRRRRRSCAATTAASSRRPSRLSKLGADALYLNTAFAGPQLTEVVQREKPKAIVYDEEFYELLEDAGNAASASSPGTTRPTCADPTLDELIARRPSDVVRPTARARGDPHLGHHRHAEGRVARQPAVARPGGVAPVADPAEGAADGPHRRAAVPLLGLRALLARADPRQHLRAAPQVRPRRRRWPRSRAHARRAGRGAGDDAADPRPARGDAREVRRCRR